MTAQSGGVNHRIGSHTTDWKREIMNKAIARRVSLAGAAVAFAAVAVLGAAAPANARIYDGFGYSCTSIQVGYSYYSISCSPDFSGVTSSVSSTAQLVR
jgi:hypothetical protein